MTLPLETYCTRVIQGILGAAISDAASPIGLADGLVKIQELLASIRDVPSKIMFVGNGGSAAIASHMAIDFAKAGRMPAQAFNDGAWLTCLGNDYSFAQIFAKSIELIGRPGDVVVAISSSGQSDDILQAVSAGRKKGCRIITLSGFEPDNPLRHMGDYNIYVAAPDYGTVEIAHYMILHYLLDVICVKT